MAARKTSRPRDDEVLDPVEAAAVEDDEEDDAFADDHDDDDDDHDEALDPVAELDADEALPDTGAVVEAVFDDDEIVVAVTGEDDDEDDVEGLREGEFVCRSCFMAKRDIQLADPERILCRDCA